MKSEITDSSLTAYYDLAVSPISFDFAVFLILAELHRRETDSDRLRVIIVPGGQDGFREDDSAYDIDNKRWRLQNIIIPLTTLLDHEVALEICPNRNAAANLMTRHKGPVFPEGYTVAEPVADFFLSSIVAASARGKAIPSFRAGPQALRYMSEWLGHQAGDKKPVTITLRESDYNLNQNSNLEAWISFAGDLDLDIYCPIFVPDTAKCFAPQPEPLLSFRTCTVAAVNLQLRAALYELSWLNMMVPNGPGELCRLSDSIRYLYFKVVSGTADTTSTLLIASQGIEIGGQLPHATPFQRLIWEPDDHAAIIREFDTMARRIGDAGAPISLAPSADNARDPMETAVQLQMTGRLEEATSIYQDIVQNDPENADAWHFLGIIAQQAGRTDAAERLVMRALSLKDDQANYFVTIGHIERELGKLEEARNAFARAITLAPEDAGAHADLADLLLETGDLAQSQASMMRALQLAPETIDYYERAGKLLRDGGNMEEAANFFSKAIELREKSEEIARQKAEQMSEVPQVTLGTG